MKNNILYLDDTFDQRNMVKMILETVGIQVETAVDGQEGLRKVANNRPDLILLDLRMPKLGGFEFLKIIKSQPNTKDIPVVVISAWANSASQEEVMSAGAAAFITKPYELDELISVVQKHLAR